MSILQLKVDYFSDKRIKGIINTTTEGGDATHILLFLATKVINRKEYDGRTITINELRLSFGKNGEIWLFDVLDILIQFRFIEIDTTGMITVLENNLWEII